MSERMPAEVPVDGAIEMVVEAAPQGLLRYTLDPEGPQRFWNETLLAHDDSVIGAATSPEQTAELLVRGSIACIAREIPSLVVGGLTMRPEMGPHSNAQIVAAGAASFKTSEWEAVRRRMLRR
ncbi:hypothetical protein HWD99_06530 [Microbacterium sp. C5A9]|uniref:hypothetical protein n=1 Tax=Microbacterium sp. C5A9 TaxID=2736663 RepID=UPI001F527B14|nr:hypothetical protein [Microbacterium sp. C5A9]MCI1018271.1 hypothetical protein [Microbacterium sp. C5A9]